MCRKTLTFLLIFNLLFIPILMIGNAHISKFRARREHNEIVIEWKTESENNVVCFEIERSANKVDWQKIVAVPSKSGNSNSPQYYDYRDTDNSLFKSNASSLNYRLIIVSKDPETNAETSETYYVIASVSGSSGIRHTWGSLKAMFR